MSYRVLASDPAGKPVPLPVEDWYADYARYATMGLACLVADTIADRAPTHITITVIDNDGVITYAVRGKVALGSNDWAKLREMVK